MDSAVPVGSLLLQGHYGSTATDSSGQWDPVSLEDLVSRGALEQLQPLAAIAETSVRELATESALAAMNAAWREIPLPCLPYRDSGTFVLGNASLVEVAYWTCSAQDGTHGYHTHASRCHPGLIFKKLTTDNLTTRYFPASVISPGQALYHLHHSCHPSHIFNRCPTTVTPPLVVLPPPQLPRLSYLDRYLLMAVHICSIYSSVHTQSSRIFLGAGQATVHEP